MKRLPHETVTVGVFRDEAPQRVIEIANQIGLPAVQLHGVESVADTQWIASRAGWTIKAFPAGHRNIGRFEEYGAQLLLIDGANPGVGRAVRLASGRGGGRSAAGSSSRVGCGPKTWGRPSPTSTPGGSTCASGVESSPGVKDPVKLREFITAAHDAARAVAAAPSVGAAAADASATEARPEDHDGPFDWQDE